MTEEWEHDGWWWIDYLENEMDPALEHELETLLKLSAEDRDLFENFRLLREWLHESDPAVDHPVDDARFARVRAHVMNRIYEEDDHSLSPATKALSVSSGLGTSAKVLR